jgi:hypothetical protein
MTTTKVSTKPLTNRFVTNKHDTTGLRGVIYARVNTDQGLVLWDGTKTPTLEWLDELVGVQRPVASIGMGVV